MDQDIISNIIFFAIGFAGLGFAFWLIRMQIKKGKCVGCSECESCIKCENASSNVLKNSSKDKKQQKNTKNNRKSKK